VRAFDLRREYFLLLTLH